MRCRCNCVIQFTSIASGVLTLEFAQWLYEHDDIDNLLRLTNEAANSPTNGGDQAQLSTGRDRGAPFLPRDQLRLYRFMLAKTRNRNVPLSELISIKLLRQSLILLPHETSATMSDELFDSSVNAACTFLCSSPLTLQQRGELLRALTVLRVNQAPLSVHAKLNLARLLFKLASKPGHPLTAIDKGLCFEAQNAIATHGTNPYSGCSCQELNDAFRYCIDFLQHHPNRDWEHGYIVCYSDFLFSYGKAAEALKLLKRLEGIAVSNENLKRYNIARTKVEFSARNYRWCAANLLFNGPPSAQLAEMYSQELYTALRIGISRSRTGAVSDAIAMCEALREARALVKTQRPVDWFSIEDQENVFLIESGNAAEAAAHTPPRERYGTMYSKALAFLKLSRWKEAIAETPAEIERSKFDNLAQSEHITAGFQLDFATIRFESTAAIGNKAAAVEYLSQVFQHYINRRDNRGIMGYPDPERILRARSVLVKIAKEGSRTETTIGLADNILAGLGCRLPAR